MDRAEKTQGRKNSSKKLKDPVNFGDTYCKNQQKRRKNKGETIKMPKSGININEGYKFNAKSLSF